MAVFFWSCTILVARGAVFEDSFPNSESFLPVQNHGVFRENLMVVTSSPSYIFIYKAHFLLWFFGKDSDAAYSPSHL